MTTSAPSFESLRAEALGALASAQGEAGLEAWRVEWLGRQDGRVTAILRSVKDQPPGERATFGAGANALKTALEAAFEETRESLKRAELESLATTEALDVTLPGRPQPVGRLHPVTQTMRDCLAAFAEMGFRVVEGPEVEWATTTSMPRASRRTTRRATCGTRSGSTPHRRRSARCCFARTQRRTRSASWSARPPPIRVVVPGKCYRQEATDATHEWMLTQIEGLAVDEGVRMTRPEGHALRVRAQDVRRTTARSSSTTATSPSSSRASRWRSTASSAAAAGCECHTCHGTGWIEILGAGMVHPEIIENAGYDSSTVHGLRLRHRRRARRAAALGHRRHPPLLPERPSLPEPVLGVRRR